MRVLCLIGCFFGFAGLARAEPAQTVGVLPFVSETPALAIYEKPVANALTQALTGKVPGTVFMVRLDRPPRDLDRVVDGTLVRKGRRVSLRARVRDIRQGMVLITAATEPRPLTEIDRLPAELAETLIPVLSEPVVEEQPEAPAQPSAPPLVVFRTWGTKLPGHVPRAEFFAQRFGHRMVIAEPGAAESRPALVAEMQKASARIALAVRFDAYVFRPSGSIYLGRGALVVALVDATGQALFERRVVTDTIVGRRGDGPDALLGMMTEQALDMVVPDVRKLGVFAPGGRG